MSRWFGESTRDSRARVTLFCLPYSGGGASIYGKWKELFPPEVEICPVHLPGREERIDESLEISPEVIANVLVKRMDLPFAVYGHSMGARLGFEVLRSLQRIGAPHPVRFYAAACSPPDVSDTLAASALLPDEELIDTLERRIDTPRELRDLPALRQLLLPVIRHDLMWCLRYKFEVGEVLQTSVLAIAGREDREATPEKMAGWSRHTANCKVLLMPGGHFFLRTASRRLTTLLSIDLLGALTEPDLSASYDSAGVQS